MPSCRAWHGPNRHHRFHVMTRSVVSMRSGGIQPAPTAADASVTPVPPDVNLLDGELYAGDPSDVYRRLREEAPAYWDDTNRLWGISRYHDVVEVEKDTRRYTSSKGSRPLIVGDVS